MRGTTALLPCNIHATATRTNAISNKERHIDPVLLVLWYKNASITPVYSYDSRGKTSGPGGRRQWGDESVWGVESQRAWFDTTTTPATLRIRNVIGTDEGTYRCKVDFKSSPSWSQRINLIVKDPTGFPRIQDESGSRLEGRVGPYNDGAVVKIICQSSGEPPPQLEWRGAGSENRGRYDMSEGLSTSRLTIVASRATAGASISCSATTNIGGKLRTNTTSIIFRVKLAPLSVSMESPGIWVVGGQQSKFGCRVVGGRPSVIVQWWLLGHQLKRNIKNERSQNGNVTLSTVQFTPTPEHDKMPLVCKAFAEDLPETVLQDQITLQVRYVPEATIHVGGDVKVKDGSGSVDIKEKKNIIFSCHVKANPPAYNISWFHNGKLLKGHGGKNRVTIDQQTLRLTKVSSSQQGLYTCAASNDEGDGPSNAINLNVYFAPICNQGQQFDYFLERRTSVTVSCEVEAFPPEVTFSWAIDNDKGTPQPLPTVGRPEKLRGKYTLTNIKKDHVRVLCWATNTMGLQKEACLFNILTQGRPKAVEACAVAYHTASGFVVQCPKKKMFHGGLETTFNLQVYLQSRTTSSSSGHKNEGKNSTPTTSISFGAVDDLVRNLTNKDPFFVLRGLPAGREFLVAIRASNSEGSSPPSTFSAFTLRDTAQTLKGMPSATTGSGSTGNQLHDKEEGIVSETKGKKSHRNSGEENEDKEFFLGGSSFIPIIMIILAASLTLIVLLSAAIIIGVRRRGLRRRVKKELEQIKINEELPYMQNKEPSSVSSERTEETPSQEKSPGLSNKLEVNNGDNSSHDLMESSLIDDDLNTKLLVHNIDLDLEYNESRCVSLHPSTSVEPMNSAIVATVRNTSNHLPYSPSHPSRSSLEHRSSISTGVSSINSHLITNLSGGHRAYQPRFPSVTALSSSSPEAQMKSLLPLSCPRPSLPSGPSLGILSSTLPKRAREQTLHHPKMGQPSNEHSTNSQYKQAQSTVDFKNILLQSPVPLLEFQQLATDDNSHPPCAHIEGKQTTGSVDERLNQKPSTVTFHPIIHVNIVPDVHSKQDLFANGDHEDCNETTSSL